MTHRHGAKSGGGHALQRRGAEGRTCPSHVVPIVVISSLAVFLLLLADVMLEDPLAIDTGARILFVGMMRTGWLTSLMQGLSALIEPVVLAVMLLLIVAFAPGRRPGLCCTVNLIGVAALNEVLKHLIRRPRPQGFRLVVETGFSFPSAHAMAATAFFGLIVWLIWRYEHDRARRASLCAILSLAVVLIGISRIYLGVHYATDVLAGFCVSLIWLALYIRLIAPLILGDRRDTEHARRGPARPRL